MYPGFVVEHFCSAANCHSLTNANSVYKTAALAEVSRSSRRPALAALLMMTVPLCLLLVFLLNFVIKSTF